MGARMTRGLVYFVVLLAAGCAAWQPSKAQAAEEDTQFWLVVTAGGEIAESTRLTLDASQRWREAARGGDQQTLRFTLERTVAQDVRIGAGAMVLEANGTTELRPHQQVTFALGPFEARTRLEQRFFDGADRVEVRLRQRLQYVQPLGDGWRANIGAEWLGLLQGRNAGEGASTEQWRAQAGVAYRIGERLDLGANYWLLVFPQGDRPARLSHVPQATLTWRF